MMDDFNKNPIVGGLAMIALGSLFLYLFVFRKIQDVTDGIGNIYTSFALSGVGPVFILLGLFYCIVRPQSLKPEEMLLKQRYLYWIMITIGAIVGLSTAFWLRNYFEETGYTRP